MSITDGWHYREEAYAFQNGAIVVIADVDIADIHVVVYIVDTDTDNALAKCVLHGEVSSDVEVVL